MQIGLIGCGDWGRHILRDLVSLGAEVSVVARSGRSQANARNGGAARIVHRIDQLDATFDGYVIAIDPAAHLDAVEALLPNGRPIYVEKPLGIDLERIRRLPATAHRLVHVMHKWRYHGGIDAMRAIAASGELGRVTALRTTRLDWQVPSRGVDPVWVLLPHDLSIALHILGDIPPIAGAWPDALGCPGEGCKARLGTSPGETVVEMHVSAAWHEKCRSVVLATTEALVALPDALADHLVIRRRGAREIERRPIATDMPLLGELRAFVEHVRGGPPPMSSLAEETLLIARLVEIRRMAGLGG